MSKFIPYTYLIGWSRLDRWYYGVEYSNGYKTANPENLWNTYFTSSDIVERFRTEYGEPDVIEIRKKFDDPIKARNWETRVIQRLRAVQSDRWLNANAGGMLFETDEQKKRRIGKTVDTKHTKMKNGHRYVPWNKNLSKSDDPRVAKNAQRTKSAWTKKIAEGWIHPGYDPEHGRKISKANKGKAKTEEHRRKLSEANKGKRWYTDGETNILISPSHEIPVGFYAGRTNRVS